MPEIKRVRYQPTPAQRAVLALCKLRDDGRVEFDVLRFQELGNPDPDELVKKVLGDPSHTG